MNVSLSILPSSFAFIWTPTLGDCPVEPFRNPVLGEQGQEAASVLPPNATGRPESRFLGTQSWRWTSPGISGPDFGPGVPLACPQPTEPEQVLSLGGRGTHLVSVHTL